MADQTRLTPAQRRILAAAARHTHGRVVGGDQRTRELLLARGLIEPDGFHSNGPLFKITVAGRQSAVGTGAHHATKKTAPAQLDREIAQVVGFPVEVVKKWRSKVAAYKRAVAAVEEGYTDEGHLKMARARDALDKMIYEAAGHVYVPGRPAHESEPIRALERERAELVSSTWAQAQERGREANYRRYREESKRLHEEEREARRPYEWMRR